MKRKLKASLLFIVSSLVLTSCDTSGITGSISDAVANALPNLWITLAQLGAFLVMVFIFFKFAFKPIKAKLKARQDAVMQNITDSEKAKHEAELDKETASANIKNSRVQAQQIVEDASKEASIKADAIIKKANEDADIIRAQGEKDAMERQKQVDRDAHNIILTTAIDASKQILGREINESDNEKVVNDFIDQMKKED
jgi:F-type H+-transporting ATPase subunit b